MAVKLSAAYTSNVVETPSNYSPLTVKRSAFTNKALVRYVSLERSKLELERKLEQLIEIKSSATIEDFSVNVVENNTKVKSVDKATDPSTTSAETVVSAIPALKGPENWGMIEELAELLGAATACSKPVSDLGWRPHGEHVGQTGKPVASNLYIAIGISGAIQHLAGVNSSKVKVVINNDPEAPFFKAADYGVVGDAFEVIPKLIE